MSSNITSIPRVWATSANYSAGPDVGTPTKVDPGAALAAEGFEPGPVAAQHVNFELNGLSTIQRRALALMQKPRLVADDTTAANLAAVTIAPTNHTARFTLVTVAGEVAYKIADMGHATTANAPTSVTTILAAATDGLGNVVVFGVGGNGNSYSTDKGETWSSPHLLNASTLHGIWHPHTLKFLGLYAGNVAHGTAAGSWTAVGVTGAGASNMSVLAGLSSGTVLTDVGVGSYQKSTDGGLTWSAATAPDNTLGCTNQGRLAGNNGSLIYHAVLLPGGSYQISSTPDGTTWTVLSTIVPPFGFVDFDDNSVAANGPGLAVCPDTGWVFFLAANEADATWFLYASPDGITWTDPHVLTGNFVDTRSLQASLGRVFISDTKAVFASDGVGTV